MNTLPRHNLAVALVAPQIAGNAGNVARTCVAAGAALHLVRPMGFTLDEKRLRRSAMDYWPRLDLHLHDDLPAFQAATRGRRLWLFDSAGGRSVFSADFADGDVLVFGSETRGLPPAWLASRPESCLAVPQQPGERCLNLATAVGIGLYAAIGRLVGAE
ncbi:MAG: tRNA (cytidine(34)-2'-O)-methyltransferase [Phycisphaerae bacterium]